MDHRTRAEEDKISAKSDSNSQPAEVMRILRKLCAKLLPRIIFCTNKVTASLAVRPAGRT